jgi:hypothetical protein
MTQLPPWRWILVDDGETPARIAGGARPLTHLRRAREPTATGAQSLCRNLLTALDHLATWPTPPTYILFAEDDDWYAPTYISALLTQLAQPGILLAGDDTQRYYHVGLRRHRTYANKGASLCQTGMHSSLLPSFAATVRQCLLFGTYGVDGHFWAAQPPATTLLTPTLTTVGIKGLPGRHGLGVGHRLEIVRKWTPDPELAMLRRWIGDDVAQYAQYDLTTSSARAREDRP